jgi:pyrroloquinoline quinone (PQQ) biosynthesis protein C
MGGSDVIARLDTIVTEYLDRVRYFHEPITLGRAQTFVLQQWKNNRQRNSVLKLKVAANCPIWDVKLRIFGACAEEIVGDDKHAGGRPHWEIIEELGMAIGLSRQQIHDAPLLPNTEINWLAWETLMSNSHWLVGLVSNTCAERSTLPGYGSGEIAERGTTGVERSRWAESFGLDDGQLEYFTVHGIADIDHSNIGWDAVARYASELHMEDAVVDACRVNFLLWESYFEGICNAGDALDRDRAG